MAPSYTDGLDAAPGGRFDMNSIASAATGNAILTEFLNNLAISYFDFIPVWSSMAVSNSTNLYAPITSASVTPFITSSVPTSNENHVTLTDANVAYALSEIITPLATQQNLELTSLWITNPVQNSVQINSSYSIENAAITITDVLGKTIYFSPKETINGSLDIPVNLSNGVYLITIQTENGSVTKKVIKG
jgi:hypothetical protein